jgi:hypothetical protein
MGLSSQTLTSVYTKYCQQFHKNCSGHDFGLNNHSSDEIDDENDQSDDEQ